MKKDVIIKVKSLVDAGGEADRFEVETRGKMLVRGRSVFLTYRETDSIGYEGCSVLIRADGESCVTVRRMGDVKSQLVIEAGRRNLCSYEMPGGTTILGITCSFIRVKRENGIPSEISASYELDVNSGLISKNQLFIKIKECLN